MARQVASRTERRMEKKQVLFLLFLVLAVSLLSFTLGVMVGRRGATPQVVLPPVETPARIPVAKDGGVPASASPTPTGEAAMQARPGENLTFYDALPKGDQAPLGSGINHPPEEKKPAPDAAATPASPTAVAPAPVKPAPTPAVTTKPAPAPEPVAAAKPAPAATGGYVVQVASFPQLADAQALKERLAKKGYQAYAQEADLGPKGVWHRVYIGPFDDSATAGKTVERLVAEERLSALVRKR